MQLQKIFKFWFPVVLYSAIIYYGSSIPIKKAPLPIPYLDKILHILEYTPFGFLIGRALFYSRAGRIEVKILVTAVMFLCFLHGLLDEYHQSFVPGRESSLNDALADMVGGFLGGGILSHRTQKKDIKE